MTEESKHDKNLQHAQDQEGSDTAQSKKRWYVIHAYSGYEQFVKQALQERIKRDGIEDKFGDILVPTEEVVELRGGQKRKSARKFFPGYVLVEMVMDDETWHLVRSVPKSDGLYWRNQ